MARLARQLHPLAITLDALMPGMDGWTVLTALKTDPELADIPVIMLTIEDDMRLGSLSGALDYLTKPDRNGLVAALQSGRKAAAHPVLVAEDDPGEPRGWCAARWSEGRRTVVESENGRWPSTAWPKGCGRPYPAGPDDAGDGWLRVSGEFRKHPEYGAVPVVVVTAKELTEEDRLFLNGSMLLSRCAPTLLQKGTFSLDDMLCQLRELLARC